MYVIEEITVAVIGGTRGLGASLVRCTSQRGLRTVVYGRSVGVDHSGLQRRVLDLSDHNSVAACDVTLGRPTLVFWVAGAFLKSPLTRTSDADIDGLTALLLTGPVKLLRRILEQDSGPIHLVTIASSSSWRRRENETLYCALKAAQAQFTRALVPELVEAHPANRVTLIQPGGLAVPDFHTGLQIDYGAMMDPDVVADIIVNHALAQEAPFDELQILRDRTPGREGIPLVTVGPRVPEYPL